MDIIAQGAIVVGVTGPGRETAALLFAAECARRENVEVVLVHAFGAELPPPPPSVLITYAEARDVAEWVVKEVEQEFEELTGGSPAFRTAALVGAPKHVLVELSREARLIVLQHRDSHWLGRLFVGSTANGVASHSDCPVVSVPTGWEPDKAGGEVVVGVHEGGAPRQLLEAAFDWAAATGAPVRVVHAWHLDAAYDDIITDRVATAWRDGQRQELQAATSGFRDSHPTVSVELEVRHQWPAQVLVDDSQVASLVVVGRHAGHGRLLEHLGSVARTVLREAKSPVMVVPVRTSHETEDWGLVADELSPQT
ncbi:universal stress protein [Nocardioides astragali]|uniref:Universal stress protein n=1 Tax=Nocardioides astragali TaxID=1776736 RepID=A0ABW2NBH0_9ACTN|nr:universal stress protein [Nocardioides astragali]